jgi:hypothetical protein
MQGQRIPRDAPRPRDPMSTPTATTSGSPRVAWQLESSHHGRLHRLQPRRIRGGRGVAQDRGLTHPRTILSPEW